MEIFKIKKDIPFMSYGRLTTAISLITFLFAIFFIAATILFVKIFYLQAILECC
jgi:preprotein translocase subunit SecF